MPASASVPFQITGLVVNKRDAAGIVPSGDGQKNGNARRLALCFSLCEKHQRLCSSGDLGHAEAVLDSFLTKG